MGRPESPAPEKVPNAQPRLLYPQGRGLGEDVGCWWRRHGSGESRNLSQKIVAGIAVVSAAIALAFLAGAVLQSL